MRSMKHTEISLSWMCKDSTVESVMDVWSLQRLDVTRQKVLSEQTDVRMWNSKEIFTFGHIKVHFVSFPFFCDMTRLKTCVKSNSNNLISF